MTTKKSHKIYTCSAHKLNVLPLVSCSDFREKIIHLVQNGARLAAFFGRPITEKKIRLTAVLARDEESKLQILETDVQEKYPAITPECIQANLFEREIAEQWGIVPEGHPWLKPVRYQPCYKGDEKSWQYIKSDSILPGVTNYYQFEGEEIHEVAVGPIHAGVIEPGHFRFQCHGEKVFHLEISLGYQHRGVEKALYQGPDKRTIHYMETLAGDTTIGHTLAYCQAVEALASNKVPARAQALRAIALELERLANHTGDLGALAGDMGYLPTASFCGRLRGEFLNLTAMLCGNRFGRNFIRPGGVVFDLDEDQVAKLLKQLKNILRDVTGAVQLLWQTPSVLARLEGVATLSRHECQQLGMVGPSARACGLERDVRYEFPSGMYTMTHIPIAIWKTGDAFGRAYVRWLEIQRSVAFIEEQLNNLPKGSIGTKTGSLGAEKVVVSMVEGWRGEICHVVMTDSQGRFSRYKVVDPSFHNWMGVAIAMRNQQISDFPLCNKSFNLSYCGHDL